VSVDVPVVGVDAVADIAAACAGTGCFVIADHGLDLGPIFAAARSFFALPAAEKERSAMVDDNGYAGIGSARAGAKEMMDIGRTGFDRWPDLDGFRATVEAYSDAVLGLAGEVLAALATGLDLEAGFFAARMRHPQCFLRMLRSPPGARPGAAVTGQHTDYGAITLLATDGVPGLEVLTRDRTDWVPVAAPADTLVVNLGDMLARWTNDRYVSTPHRVVARGPGERVSIPFFVNPDPETTVACIPSCVSAARPCRYAPITAGEFLRGRIDGTIPLADVRSDGEALPASPTPGWPGRA
jgi:isopenicillin N synthase-like dioxygenase